MSNSKALIDMEKGKLFFRVGENKFVFKFLLTPIPSSNLKDSLYCITQTNYDVSFSSQETKSLQQESPKASKCKGSTSSPKPEKDLMKGC